MKIKLNFSIPLLFILLLWISCKEDSAQQKVNTIPKPAHFSEDSAKAVSIVIYAAEAQSPKVGIDTLKPLIEWFANLCLSTNDSIMCVVYENVLFEIGYGYQNLNMYDSCYSYLQKCYDICSERHGEDYLMTTMCLNKLSFYYNYIGQVKKQKELLFKSFDIRRRILDKNDLFLAYAYGNMAGYYFDIGDVIKANMYHNKSVEIIKNQYLIYDKSNNPLKDTSLIRLQNVNKTLPKVLNQMLTSLPTRFAFQLIFQAEHLIDEENLLMAEYKLKQVDTIIIKYPKIKNFVSQGYFTTKLNLYTKRNEFSKANKMIDSISNLAQFKEKESLRMPLIERKCYLLSKEGKYEEAIKLLNQEYNKSEAKSITKLFKYNRLCQLYQDSKNYNMVVETADTAYRQLFTMEQYRNFLNIIPNWRELGPVTSKNLIYLIYYELTAKYELNKVIKDTKSQSRFVNQFEILNNGLIYLQEANFTKEGKISEEVELYPLYERAIDIALELYQVSKDESLLLKIQKWSESHKAIALVNSIILKNDLNESHQPKVISDYIDLKNQIERIKLRVIETGRNNSPSDSTILNNLNNSLVQLSGDLEVLSEKNKEILESIFDPSERIEYPSEKIQAYLGANASQLIDYFVGDSNIYVSLLSDSSKSCLSIKLNTTNRELIDSFISSALSKEVASSNYKALSNKVYNLLIHPIENKLTSKRLIIIPDGFLFRLPFELLQTNEYKLLVENFSIQYEFSSKLLLKKTINKARKSYAGFAPEYIGNEEIIVSNEKAVTRAETYEESRAMLGPLKFNIPEVLECAKIMNGSSFVGPLADKFTFKDKSKDARIVHLAMHAITDDQNPDYSQLLFKSKDKNEPLFAYELNEYEMHSELAILSACNTGIGRYRRGDGVQSMARAFKGAGCKNIVMSLWPANDASTKDIVVGFLKNLKAGMGKADALRKSKLDYLKTAPEELKLPYYWAGLILIGDNDAMKFDSNNYLSILLVAIAILGILFIWYRQSSGKLFF
ncbi:MAG: CHAT domain-containing protein [Saprospiraceae bacterium]